MPAWRRLLAVRCAILRGAKPGWRRDEDSILFHHVYSCRPVFDGADFRFIWVLTCAQPNANAPGGGLWCGCHPLPAGESLRQQRTKKHGGSGMMFRVLSDQLDLWKEHNVRPAVRKRKQASVYSLRVLRRRSACASPKSADACRSDPTLTSVHLHHGRKTAWAAGKNGIVFRSSGGGSSWLPVDVPGEGELTAIRFWTAGERGWATGRNRLPRLHDTRRSRKKRAGFLVLSSCMMAAVVGWLRKTA